MSHTSTSPADLKDLHHVIQTAGEQFKQMLAEVLSQGGLQRKQYVRYLQMQYHLTLDVQQYFLAAASHPSLSGKREYRDFLYHFGLEEEPHFGIAANDLKALGAEVGEAPLDVKLWHAYFTDIVQERPYVRLGAACVLETIGTIAGDVIKPLLAGADFLSDANTRFVVIHMHEVLPHGAQFLLELTNSDPSVAELQDVVQGAREGATLYLRMAAWALGTDALQQALSANC